MFGRRANGNGQSVEVDGNCDRHAFEKAAGLCRSCQLPYCAECLVFSFGPTKPPFCLPCALQAGGIRKSSRARL
jgi:hypothetical protein